MRARVIWPCRRAPPRASSSSRCGGSQTLALPAAANAANNDDDDALNQQEWWGLNQHMVNTTDKFAAHGFAAVCPDLYVVMRHRAASREQRPHGGAHRVCTAPGTAARWRSTTRLQATSCRASTGRAP